MGDVKKPLVVVVTGLSGAGRTTALHALEDLGFFCIDNLPTVLAPDAVSLCETGGMSRVALGMDVRVRAFLGEVGRVLSLLEDSGNRDVHVLFLDATDEAILRRFSETRRPHALATSGTLAGAASVLEGITLERERLSPLRARATRVVDTTSLSVHELRRAVLAQFGPASGAAERMTMRIVSFGFKYGTPTDADIVLDVRFLRNPYFVPELKRIPGTDPRVRDYVLGFAETKEFLDRTLELLRFVVPKCEREGKSYLTVAIGCTGGLHRSVVLAEVIATELERGLHGPEPAPKITMAVVHRDVERGDPPPRARLVSEAGVVDAAASEHAADVSPRPPAAGERGPS